jgi:hypothetical protein
MKAFRKLAVEPCHSAIKVALRADDINSSASATEEGTQNQPVK